MGREVAVFGNYLHENAGRGKAVHFIPESRMKGIQAFSRWKENSGSLERLHESFRKEMGNCIADEIAMALEFLPRENIPSIEVRLPGSEKMHLPPKPALLVLIAMKNALRKGRWGEALDNMLSTPDNTNLSIQMILASMGSDMAMGYTRLYSVCCADREESEWRDFMGRWDLEKRGLSVLTLDDVPFAYGNADYAGEVMTKNAYGSVLYKRTRSILLDALERTKLVQGIIPQARTLSAYDSGVFECPIVMHPPEQYVREGARARRIEIAVPLGTITSGSLSRI